MFGGKKPEKSVIVGVVCCDCTLAYTIEVSKKEAKKVRKQSKNGKYICAQCERKQKNLSK